MIADGVTEAFQLQAMLSPQLGSPLYGQLLEAATADLQRRGVIAEVVDGWQGHAVADALALRLLGAVHYLVLDGVAPELARYYPSAGGTPQWPQAWDAFLEVVNAHRDFIRSRLGRQVQTNEVNRSAALLGGFLHIAAHTGLPLRLFEIGSSAGLNLLWDRYRYEVATHRWGDPTSSVLIRSTWHGAPQALTAAVRVDGRFGCDLHPINLRDAGQVRTLESFVWPDQVERLAQLRAAIALAQATPPRLSRQTASTWLRDQLGSAPRDITTVVFHSIMWWYLPEDERDAVTRVIAERGARASRTSPLAWLQFEVRGEQNADLAVRIWPGGDELVLARCHPHGREVWWSESQA